MGESFPAKGNHKCKHPRWEHVWPMCGIARRQRAGSRLERKPGDVRLRRLWSVLGFYAPCKEKSVEDVNRAVI